MPCGQPASQLLIVLMKHPHALHLSSESPERAIQLLYLFLVTVVLASRLYSALSLLCHVHDKIAAMGALSSVRAHACDKTAASPHPANVHASSVFCCCRCWCCTAAGPADLAQSLSALLCRHGCRQTVNGRATQPGDGLGHCSQGKREGADCWCSECADTALSLSLCWVWHSFRRWCFRMAAMASKCLVPWMWPC